MSRVGNKILQIPEGLTVNIAGSDLSVSGQKGALKHHVAEGITVMIVDNQIKVARRDNSKMQRSLHGTTTRVIENLLAGLSAGFSRKLEFKGVGFTILVEGNKMQMRLGYSHPVILEIPEGLTVTVVKSSIVVEGIDKVAVGAFAAKIREIKKPEVYKGKGIRYKEEIIKKKAGKAAQSASS
jgi:large subunit ribosomal protein L6